MADAAIPITRSQYKPTEFDYLYAAWKHAKGKWEMESYAPDCVEHGLPDHIENEHCDATAQALNTLLLHPVDCPKELARKLRIIRDEQIFDNWFKGPEIAACVAKDAARIAFGD